jgi:hypothetical protein
MKLIVILFTCLALVLSCNSEDKKLDEVAQEGDLLVTDNGQLEHMVFFSLKDTLSVDDLNFVKNQLNKLAHIPLVHEITISERKDLGDPRALDYDLLMIMRFTGESALQLYQQDPRHLNIKNSLAKYLDGAPATFDFAVE